jgi:hypothetical protein
MVDGSLWFLLFFIWAPRSLSIQDSAVTMYQLVVVILLQRNENVSLEDKTEIYKRPGLGRNDLESE